MGRKARGERDVEIGHRHRQTEIDEARHPVTLDAAGHDAVEKREVGLDVDREAVEAHPAPHPDADRGVPSGSGGFPGRATQTPTRPSRTSPRIWKRSSVSITHASSPWTKRRR